MHTLQIEASKLATSISTHDCDYCMHFDKNESGSDRSLTSNVFLLKLHGSLWKMRVSERMRVIKRNFHRHAREERIYNSPLFHTT